MAFIIGGTLVLVTLFAIGIGLLVLFYRSTAGDRDIYVVDPVTLADIRKGKHG